MRKFMCPLWIFGMVLVTACSYESEKAVKNGDVINMNGPVYNFPSFELFLDSIGANKPDSIRIANYTLEGEPTLYNLTFDGSSIELEIDRSQNNNRGDDPAKFTMNCTNLVTGGGQQVLTYTLKGCDQDSFIEGFLLLTVLKDQVDEHEH